MKIEWNKVTWYSKLGAIILFLLVVPALTFYIGMEYEKTQMILSQPDNFPVNLPVVSVIVPSKNATKAKSFTFDIPYSLKVSKYDQNEYVNYSGDYDYKMGKDARKVPNFIVDIDYFDKGELPDNYPILEKPIKKFGENDFYSDELSGINDEDVYYEETYLMVMRNGGYVQVSHYCTSKELGGVFDDFEIGCASQKGRVWEMLKTFKEV